MFAHHVFVVFQIQFLDFGPRPGRSSQELQAGFDAGVVCEAFDLDDLAHLLPSMMLHQLRNHHLKRDAVKRIFGLLISHMVAFLANEKFSGFKLQKCIRKRR